jgi:serine/threonine protein kinase/Flp pilus assembly protein TadD
MRGGTAGRMPPASTDMPFEAAPGADVCSTCRRPLTQRGPEGECLRCLFGVAVLPDDEELGLDAPRPASSEWGPLRYGHFEILTQADGSLQELGAGAMGTTYLAQDSVLHRTVALKVIGRSFAGHPETRARFLREARAAARLRHPNVASVFHYGEQDGQCFYAMELVEGENLEERVRRDGPLPAALALEVVVQVARALVAAEAQGIVHRDLKPSNVMLVAGANGEADEAPPLVKVIDFGLAKAVRAGGDPASLGDTRGGFVGTPAFASPEQYAPGEDERVDTRSDIYSLGVTLWYLLCGKLPFTGQTLTEIHQQQTCEPLPLEQLKAANVPGQLTASLRSMLAVAPVLRPQSARELLKLFGNCQAQLSGGRPGRRGRPVRRAMAAGSACLAAVIGLTWWNATRLPATPMDASIAVLPFENLSPDQSEMFFTRGVQDTITSDLARITRLRVIGPESVKAYPPGNRDLPAIGQALHVGHLLEGSVQRQGEQVHIHIRLADTRNPAQVWSAHYDRPLAQVFTIESEITREVAEHLRVTPSQTEAVVINQPPTRSLAAWDLYLHSRETTFLSASATEMRRAAQHRVELLDQAVKLDPDFMQAYCALAAGHDDITRFSEGTTPEERAIDHRALAEAALQKARRLQPDAGEVHLAQAKHFLNTGHNREEARIELDLARRALPNNADVEQYTGQIASLDGRWNEAVRAFQKAVSLEPRDPGRRSDLAVTYSYLRDYANFDRAMAAMIELTPPGDLAELPLYRAQGALEGRADLAPLRVALAEVRASDDPDGLLRDAYGLILALFENSSSEVSRRLTASRQNQFLMANFAYPRAWFQALAARMRNDGDAAETAFAAARPEVEKTVLADARDERNLLLLAMIDAGLGRKEDAISEAQRACAMEPENQQLLNGPSDRCCLAVVYAWTGHPDLAFAELNKLVAQPAGDNMPNQPTYGDLKLNPLWAPLRTDPRFETLTRKLAPRPTPSGG